MKNFKIILTFLPLTFFIFKVSDVTKSLLLHPTEKYAKPDSSRKCCQNVRIAFYNTENLYDPYDDTTKLDNEFTAEGIRHWSYSRFQSKINHLSKTLIAIGNPEPPALIGLCEVENRYVLNKLIYNSPLKRFRYAILHHESPDLRGVDVALLYRKEYAVILATRFYPIIFPFDTSLKTREILYAKIVLNAADTLHIFVNHWPSRLGGYQETREKRRYVAWVLRKAVDSVIGAEVHPKIVIMGDFNDGPGDESLVTILKARAGLTPSDPDGLVNLMYDKLRNPEQGTHKYQGEWNILDQFIISGMLLTDRKGLHASLQDAHIFNAPFLMDQDEKYFGSRPERTYSGPRYLGGFSDHLPVWLELRYNEK